MTRAGLRAGRECEPKRELTLLFAVEINPTLIPNIYVVKKRMGVAVPEGVTIVLLLLLVVRSLVPFPILIRYLFLVFFDARYGKGST